MAPHGANSNSASTPDMIGSARFPKPISSNSSSVATKPMTAPTTPPATCSEFFKFSSKVRATAIRPARIGRKDHRFVHRFRGRFDFSHPPDGFVKCAGFLVPADDLRHPAGRRGVSAALGTHDAVDDGHADAREVAELHA